MFPKIHKFVSYVYAKNDSNLQKALSEQYLSDSV